MIRSSLRAAGAGVPVRGLSAGLAVMVLGGCAQMAQWYQPRVEVDSTAPVRLAAAAPPPSAANGSLFQPTTYRPLFEDHRARMPGDTLTVQIVEKVSASQSSTSSIKKNGTVEAGVTALPGISGNALRRASASGNSSNTFDGKGATESTNDFSGVITVVVREVLPNGHLLIAGEKQIGVNANVDVLRFTGQVDPRAIQPGNVVPSVQVANVRLEHRGRGAQAEAQVIGWLARVFLSVLPI